MPNPPPVVLQHDEKVWAAAFSPDGCAIATGTGSEKVGKVRLWTISGESITEPILHGRHVTQIKFAPDGSCYISCNKDGTAQLWSSADGQRIGETLRHKKEVWGAAFHPSRAIVVTASEDKTLRSWKYPSGEPLDEPLKLPSGAFGPSFSRDGTHLTAVLDGRRLLVWSFGSDREPIALEHPAGTNAVCWSPDGKLVATCGKDRRLRIWNGTTGELLDDSFQAEASFLTGAVFLQDGKSLILSSHSFSSKARYVEIIRWDVTKRQMAFCERYDNETWCISDVSPDGQYFLSGATAHTARLMHSSDGKTVAAFPPQSNPACSVQGTAWSPDGNRILIWGLNGTAQVWRSPACSG